MEKIKNCKSLENRHKKEFDEKINYMKLKTIKKCIIDTIKNRVKEPFLLNNIKYYEIDLISRGIKGEVYSMIGLLYFMADITKIIKDNNLKKMNKKELEEFIKYLKLNYGETINDKNIKK